MSYLRYLCLFVGGLRVIYDWLSCKLSRRYMIGYYLCPIVHDLLLFSYSYDTFCGCFGLYKQLKEGLEKEKYLLLGFK